MAELLQYRKKDLPGYVEKIGRKYYNEMTLIINKHIIWRR